MGCRQGRRGQESGVTASHRIRVTLHAMGEGGGGLALHAHDLWVFRKERNDVGGDAGPSRLIGFFRRRRFSLGCMGSGIHRVPSALRKKKKEKKKKEVQMLLLLVNTALPKEGKNKRAEKNCNSWKISSVRI